MYMMHDKDVHSEIHTRVKLRLSVTSMWNLFIQTKFMINEIPKYWYMYIAAANILT